MKATDGLLLRGYLLGQGLNVSKAASVIGWSRNKLSALVNEGQEITLCDALEIGAAIAAWKARQQAEHQKRSARTQGTT